MERFGNLNNNKMKKTIKFLLYTLKYVSIIVSLPFLVATTIISFFYFVFSGVTDWSVIKIEEYES